MLSYMRTNEAIKNGFTHHESYYGIPIWITDEEIPMVATKFAPFEFVMTIFQYIESFIKVVVLLDDQPRFMFKIGAKIKID